MRDVKKVATLCLLISLYSLFYHATLDDYFFFEDFVYLERSKINSLKDIPSLFSVERSTRGFDENLRFYRPLSANFYFGLLQFLFGLHPFYFHIANLLALGLNAFLLYRLLRLLEIRALLSTLLSFLYSISFVNFKPQFYLAVGKDLICIIFIILSVNSYVSSAKNDNKRLYYLSIFFFFLSLLSKETAFALPVLLFAYNGIVRRQKLIANLKELVPFAFLAILFVLWRVLFFEIPSSDSLYSPKIGWFVVGNLKQYVLWTVRAIFLHDGMAVITVLIIAGGILFYLADSKRRLLFFFGWSWFLIALLPVIFLQYRREPYYLILPLIGALISLAALVDCLADRTKSKKAFAVLGIILISLYYVVSYRNFAIQAAKVGENRNQGKRFIEQLKLQYPQVADNTVFHFYFTPDAPARFLLINAGAGIRLVYDNPTLKAKWMKRVDFQAINRPRKGRHLFFAWTPEGVLLDLSPHPAPTPGTGR